jgi:hypothetical protein
VQAPSNVTWSTNTFDYAGSITSATWNGATVAVNRGGTGVTTSTGTGSVVLSTTPTLVTPVLGVATATSINKVALTAPASSATLTLANGSTLATSGAYSTTLTATATTAVTLPTSGTIMSSVTALSGAVTGTPSSTTYLRGDGTWASVSASPGGSTTQVQFNNAGAFGGSASFTWDGSSVVAPQQVASNGLIVNNQTIGTSYSIPSGYAASSVGPVTLSSGASVTVPTGGRWIIL